MAWHKSVSFPNAVFMLKVHSSWNSALSTDCLICVLPEASPPDNSLCAIQKSDFFFYFAIVCHLAVYVMEILQVGFIGDLR